MLILKPTDLGHFTVLSPIYPVGQISSLTFQQKLFRNSIALDSNLVKELKYALLLIAVKTVAKLYSKKKKICTTHFDTYAFIAFAEFQGTKIFPLEKFATFCYPVIFISVKMEWL